MVLESPGLNKRKKQSRWFGFLIGFGVFLIVIAVLAVIPARTYGVYKNQGISLNYPLEWKVIERPDNTPGAIVAFASPAQTAMDTYAENVNVSVQDLSRKPMTLSQFTQTAIGQFTGTFQDGGFEVVESGPAELAGRPAYKFSYTISKAEPPLKLMHIWVVVGTKGYIITYGAAEKDFDVFSAEVDSLIKSFEIL